MQSLYEHAHSDMHALHTTDTHLLTHAHTLTVSNLVFYAQSTSAVISGRAHLQQRRGGGWYFKTVGGILRGIHQI